MKKILVIGPWISGHIQQWLGDNDEYEFLILTCHKIKPNQTQYNVKCYFFVNQIFSFILFPLFIIFNYIKFRPSVTHVHFLSSYGLISSFLPRKKIISIWGSDFNSKARKNRLYKWIYTHVLKQYEIINSPGRHITNDLISYNVPKEKIITLQYGINKKMIDELKSENKDKSTKIFSSIRNWDNVYQIEQLITIWKELNLANCELWIFGKSENSACREKIENLVVNEKNITLIGFLSHTEFYTKLSLSDAFISIPKMDGTPLSVIECCYLELLPIVTNTPFYQENITTLSQCCLPIEFSSKDLLKAIQEVINCSDNEKIKITNKNKAMVIENYNLFKNREIMFDLYKAIYEK